MKDSFLFKLSDNEIISKRLIIYIFQLEPGFSEYRDKILRKLIFFFKSTQAKLET